ncbi:major facilitator superfamily domain-containing protein [Pyronema omphalodes]|nr:major facilitator superfamily domain-containing protein [Pyronema omphalodes]
MSTEKVTVDHPPASDPEIGSNSGNAPPLDTRKLLMKLDLRILPVLSLAYLFAFLDRVNVGNAAVFGLSKELNLKGTQYNFALCIFFIPYILLEIPSNALLKKIKPHRFLSGCIFMFGLTTVLQGLVTSYGGLLATRFFLGAFETGLFPGAFYLLSMWYRREESQSRFSFFFISTTLASAFGGLLASAIGKMDGVRGMLAWRWIFILEGAMTCVFAIGSYFTIPDFPEDVKWLNEQEREWVITRLRGDVGSSGRETPAVKWKDLKVIFTDYKYILGAVMYLGFIVPAYGFSYFAPTIIKGWNYTPIEAQLRTVPVAMVAWVLAMATAYASDWMKHRYWFIIFCSSITVIGFAVLMSTHGNRAVQYGGLFMSYPGAFSAMPLVVCYFQTNLAGHTRRSIGSAFQISFGNLGGVIATFIFLAKDGPYYITGYSVCIAFTILTMITSTFYVIGIRRENKLREAGLAGIVVENEEDEGEIGDMSRKFRYIL